MVPDEGAGQEVEGGSCDKEAQARQIRQESALMFYSQKLTVLDKWLWVVYSIYRDLVPKFLTVSTGRVEAAKE